MKRERKQFIREEAHELAALILQSNMEAGGLFYYADSKGFTPEDLAELEKQTRLIRDRLFRSAHPKPAQPGPTEEASELENHPFGGVELFEASPYAGTYSE